MGTPSAHLKTNNQRPTNFCDDKNDSITHAAGSGGADLRRRHVPRLPTKTRGRKRCRGGRRFFGFDEEGGVVGGCARGGAGIAGRGKSGARTEGDSFFFTYNVHMRALLLISAFVWEVVVC